MCLCVNMKRRLLVTMTTYVNESNDVFGFICMISSTFAFISWLVRYMYIMLTGQVYYIDWSGTYILCWLVRYITLVPWLVRCMNTNCLQEFYFYALKFSWLIKGWIIKAMCELWGLFICVVYCVYALENISDNFWLH